MRGIWPKMFRKNDHLSWGFIQVKAKRTLPWHIWHPKTTFSPDGADRIRRTQRERTGTVLDISKLLFLQDPLKLIEPLWQGVPTGWWWSLLKGSGDKKWSVTCVQSSWAKSPLSSHGTLIKTWVQPAWHQLWCYSNGIVPAQQNEDQRWSFKMLSNHKLSFCRWPVKDLM